MRGKVLSFNGSTGLISGDDGKRYSFSASDLMGGRQWLIVVGDDDVGVASATSGETICQIDGALTAADFRDGTFTRVGVASCFSATFRLSCHL